MCFQIDFSNDVNATVDSDWNVTSFDKFKTIQPTTINSNRYPKTSVYRNYSDQLMKINQLKSRFWYYRSVFHIVRDLITVDGRLSIISAKSKSFDFHSTTNHWALIYCCRYSDEKSIRVLLINLILMNNDDDIL